MPVDQKQQIEDSIKQFADGNLFENAINLFNALKYDTHLQAPLDDPSWEVFQQMYVSNGRFNEKMALASDWKYVNILFQLSENAIKQQIDLFSAGRFDSSIMYSFLYICIELNKEHYTKTQLSQITRELNKVFAMPVMVLFKTGSFLTLSLINRRLHKRDDTKDVLEKVTLIKDIAIESPHRAHIEILFDLSFNELYRKYGFTHFVELHQAWQKTLDIKELNKRFFKELFNWYLWAIRNVRFPNKVDDASDDTTFNQEAVIRLLTRLIFIWFIKEKNLVPDHLFNKRSLRNVLRDFDPHSQEKSDYYRAILQNLFFATLNTPMDKDITDKNRDEKRGFIVPGMPGGRANPHYTDQTRYRYKECFVSESQALKLFETIPFLNGGLFECLDFPPEDSQPELRIDGFSTKRDKQAFVPNALFFKEEFILDLNEEYGTRGKQYKVKGLIPILSGYKFTITENTTLEEEVALDPELLGKVFENLLATYNPETKSTARKQTGSFYTPREIVNYMVDESLIALLSNMVDKEEVKADADKEKTEQRLRYLISPEGIKHDFDDQETMQVIHSLSHCRILDPACGSGAFPMGILHRIVDLLGKLDPNNKHWKEIQKERALQETKEAYDIGDKDERHHRLEEINKAFDESINNPDYARKLFLIENCIYGVDIQQIAVQIAKLRFFISLIAEQKVDDNKPNRNILSMPNLETKFVAANTLIGLEKPQGQLSIMDLDPELEKKEYTLKLLRHKIFFTRRYHEKKTLKQQEKVLRQELKDLLIRSDFPPAVAEQVTSWNPFDPLHSSPFFDVETMFGFTGGFDVVIGNPPYISYYSNRGNILSHELRKYYLRIYEGVKKINDRINSMNLMVEKGIKLLDSGGHLSFITNKTIAVLPSYIEVRRFILSSAEFKYLVTDLDPFEAVVDCLILGLNKRHNTDYIMQWYKGDLTDFELKNVSVFSNNSKLEFHFPSNSVIVEKIKMAQYKLNDLININRGVNIGGCSESFLSSIRQSNDYWRYIPGTSNISYFKYTWAENDGYMIFDQELENELREQGETLVLGNHERYECERLFIPESGQHLMAAYCNEEYYSAYGVMVGTTSHPNFLLKYACALLNSNLLTFYAIETEILRKGKKATPHIGVKGLNNIPVHLCEQGIADSFSKIVDYCIYAFRLSTNEIASFLHRVVNAMVYELYFSVEFTSHNCNILSHLTNLPRLNDNDNIEDKLAIIQNIYTTFSDPSHPVSIAMARMKVMEEVRIIEGAVSGRRK
jgi:tRNA1(Val) A37 N6-methylase TrmN6